MCDIKAIENRYSLSRFQYLQWHGGSINEIKTIIIYQIIKKINNHENAIYEVFFFDKTHKWNLVINHELYNKNEIFSTGKRAIGRTE